MGVERAREFRLGLWTQEIVLARLWAKKGAAR